MFNIPAILTPPFDGGFEYPYLINQSCMFSPGSSNRMQKNHTETATSQQRGTMSVWLKRSVLGNKIFWAGRADTAGRYSFIGFAADNQLQIYMDPSSPTANMHSQAAFRDLAGWYHFVVAFDTPQATASNRIKAYVNGDQIVDWSATDYPNQNDTIRAGDSDENVYWGCEAQGPTLYFDGYLAQACWIDGTAYDADDFGELINGIWCPKDLSGLSYGINGHLLDFADSGDLGNDVSGQGHDMTAVTGFGTDHQVLDSPTNNHCTLDDNATRSARSGMLEGALKVTQGGNSYTPSMGTFLMKTGKWYWEVDLVADYQWLSAGIVAADEKSEYIITDYDRPGMAGMYPSWALDSQSGVWNKIVNSVSVGDDNLSVPAVDSIIQIAFDADANKLWFGVNGTWGDFGPTGVGDPAAGTNPSFDNGDGIDAELYDLVPCTAVYANTSVMHNFGQKTFAYTPPTGFKSLCTGNLPQPAHLKPNVGMDVVAWSGDDASPRSITDLSFQPDFVWIKNLTDTNAHIIFDSVRGAIKTLIPHSTAAQDTDGYPDGWLSAFISNGFTLTEGTGVSLVNESAHDYVALCLKKSASFGFDIVQYTGDGIGQSINHSLGAAPELMIVKNIDTARNWNVYHHFIKSKADPETDFGELNLATAFADQANVWDDTAPTSTQFTVGAALTVNDSGDEHIAYLWRSIPGFSKVGSLYTTGSLPYVYCGFRPRWIMLKSDYASDSWLLYDTERDTYNDALGSRTIYADTNAAEDGPGLTAAIDINSNGFKLRNNSNAWLYTDIAFLAFAERPVKFANAR